MLRRDTYVDDILSGASDLPTAKEKMRQLRDTLATSGFKLQKWIANCPDLLAGISTRDRETSAILPVDDSAVYHTFGLLWNQPTDSFVFTTPSFSKSRAVTTKRTVLSIIA